MAEYHRRGWINPHTSTPESFHIRGYDRFDEPGRDLEISLRDGTSAAHVLFSSLVEVEKFITELQEAVKWAKAAKPAPQKKKPSAK